MQRNTADDGLVNAEHLPERELAAAALHEGAAKMSAALDVFSTWLATGFGAAVALFLTSHDAQSLIPVATLRLCLLLLTGAVLLTVAQKYISIMAATAAANALSGRALHHDFVKRSLERHGRVDELDSKAIFAETMKALFPPGRGLAAKLFQKVLQGDVGAVARLITKAVQIQAMLVGLEMGLFLAALIAITITLDP